MFCPACGFKNDDNARFCKKCGEDFSDIPNNKPITDSICPYCAEEINPNAVKCKHCGEWLNKEFERKAVNKDHGSEIAIGYLFSILGGIIGLIFAIHLLTLSDKKANKHGMVMFFIFIFWFMLLNLLLITPIILYSLYLGNILIGVIFGIYILKNDIKIGAKITFVYILLFIILASIWASWVSPGYFPLFLDMILISVIYIIISKTNDHR